MFWRVVLFGILSLLPIHPATADRKSDAETLYNRAIQILNTSADISEMVKTRQQAREYLKEAADLGHKDAQARIGAMYLFGAYGEKNEKIAIRYAKAAFQQDQPEALYYFAEKLLEESKQKKGADPKQAKKLQRQAKKLYDKALKLAKKNLENPYNLYLLGQMALSDLSQFSKNSNGEFRDREYWERGARAQPFWTILHWMHNEKSEAEKEAFLYFYQASNKGLAMASFEVASRIPFQGAPEEVVKFRENLLEEAGEKGDLNALSVSYDLEDRLTAAQFGFGNIQKRDYLASRNPKTVLNFLSKISTLQEKEQALREALRNSIKHGYDTVEKPLSALLRKLERTKLEKIPCADMIKELNKKPFPIILSDPIMLEEMNECDGADLKKENILPLLLEKRVLLKKAEAVGFTQKQMNHILSEEAEFCLNRANLSRNFAGGSGAIDYLKLWNELIAKNPQKNIQNRDFYLEIYNFLKARIIKKTPDGTSCSKNPFHDTKRQISSIINVLGTTFSNLDENNDPQRPKSLGNDITSDFIEANAICPKDLRPETLAEAHYKLYKISQKLPYLSEGEARLIEDDFVHAGEYCIVAKMNAINHAYQITHPEADDIASVKSIPELLQKGMYTLKSKYLNDLIDHQMKNITEFPETPELAEHKTHIIHERQTVVDATWNANAPSLGLPIRPSYSSYALTHFNAVNELKNPLGPAQDLTPKRIIQQIKSRSTNDLKELVLSNTGNLRTYIDQDQLTNDVLTLSLVLGGHLSPKNPGKACPL